MNAFVFVIILSVLPCFTLCVGEDGELRYVDNVDTNAEGTCGNPSDEGDGVSCGTDSPVVADTQQPLTENAPEYKRYIYNQYCECNVNKLLHTLYNAYCADLNVQKLFGNIIISCI